MKQKFAEIRIPYLVIALVAVIVIGWLLASSISQGSFSLTPSKSSSALSVPQQIPYQGVLSQSDGSRVPDDTYAIQFSLYESGQGGSPIWSESQQVVTAGGIFSTMLGKLTPITASTVSVNELWLGVKVGTDPEMTPRQRIGSTVYALVAEQLANPKNPTIILSHDS